MIAIATLALGIGANTAIFSAVNAVLLRPLPYPEPERVMTVWERRAAEGVNDNVVSPADFLDWARLNASFESIAAQSFQTVDLTGGGEPVRLFTSAVSPSFFAVLGVQPAYGRRFHDDEVAIGKHRSPSSGIGSGSILRQQPRHRRPVGATERNSSRSRRGARRRFRIPRRPQLWAAAAFGADPPHSSHFSRCSAG